MVAEHVILDLWYLVVMAVAQEVELLRRELEELNARMDEVRQQSASAVMNAVETGLTEAERGQTVSKPRPGHESREARAVRNLQRLR